MVCSLEGQASGTHIGIPNGLYLFQPVFIHDLVEFGKVVIHTFYQDLRGKILCIGCKPFKIGKEDSNRFEPLGRHLAMFF